KGNTATSESFDLTHVAAGSPAGVTSTFETRPLGSNLTAASRVDEPPSPRHDRSPPEAALSALPASSAGNARASAAVVSVREVGASAPVPEWQAASAANSRRDAAIRSNGRERDITDLGIWPRNGSAREGGATYGPRRRRPSSSYSTRGPWAR